MSNAGAYTRGLDVFPSAGSSLRISLVIDTQVIRTEVLDALSSLGAEPAADLSMGLSAVEVAAAVERDCPDVLIVETPKLTREPAEWINEVRRGGDSPPVIAIHLEQDPGEMIRALRAGAMEFLSLPLGAAFQEALDRIAAALERKRTAAAQRGRVLGFLGAKGGCGVTSIACHVAAAFGASGETPGRALLADLDTQASSARSVFGVDPKWTAFDAIEQVRRLNATSWRDTVARVNPALDVLGGPSGIGTPLPEPWRIEALFQFIRTNYSFICADLGRQLNPFTWLFLQNIEELFLVTGPDVLALYQTRQILQTLGSRGFEKSRMRLILNLNQGGPQDFWKESIEQMFEMQVYFIVSHDEARASVAPGNGRKDGFEYPAGTEFGRHMLKLAAKIAGVSVGKEVGTRLVPKREKRLNRPG